MIVECLVVQVVHIKSAVFVLSQSGLARENRRRPFNCPNMGSQMLLCVDHCKFAQPLPPCQRPHHLASAWSTTQLFSCEPFYQDPPWFLHLSSLLLSRLLSNKTERRQTDLCDMLGAKLCGVGLVSVQTLVIVFQPWHSWVVDLFCRWTSIELVIFDVANRAPLLITTLVPATCNEFRSVRWMILPRMFHSDNNSVTKWTFHPCHDGFILTSHVMVWLCNTPMQSGFLRTFWVVASK